MADKKNLLYLFDRPKEPIFVPKEAEERAVFDIPSSFLTDRYKPIGNEIQTRLGESADVRIPVKEISIPDLRIPMQLARDEQFTLFIPLHRQLAGRLIDIFMALRSIDDLQSVAVYARDRINPFLYNYALSVALLHREDTKNLRLPTFSQHFPEKFVDSKVFAKIREEATLVPEGSRIPILVPKDYTASDLDVEHRLWYFREDMGINIHHWHWHLVYPFEASDRRLVDKDRRGELFYFMHQQIIGRYNYERFSNNLPRVKRMNNLREPIPEGYFPKMDSLVASRAWPARADNTLLRDIRREADQLKVDISDMERWRDRVYEAIHQGFVTDSSGNRIPLDEERGIDIIGNLLESASISVNRQLYGDFHNMGHVFLSYAHDPDHRHLEAVGPIGDPGTSMRDPAFYTFHAYMDDIMQEHKEALPPYTLPQLNYQGITVTGVTVNSTTGPADTFQTFWQQSDVNLSRGMDFVPRGNVYARFTHLQHVPFTYTININNEGGVNRFGTVRIYLAPKFDERGAEMLLRDQRLLLIEQDRFVVSLQPGANTIRRRSSESSLIVPWDRTFRDLERNRPATGTTEEEGFVFCGCGWPEHMLVPKGLPQGLQSELFVMVSNYEDDRVDQDLVGSCNDASIYCGVRDRKYPDKRPMGFPFDRLPRMGADRLSTFLTPNMFVKDCSIVHTDRTELRQS